MAHHSIVGFVYFNTGTWQWSENPVLNQLGQSTVALFFMITGFLFTEKCSAPTVRWQALYISRVARLTPLYAVVVVVVFAAVFALSGFQLHVPPSEFLMEFGQWLAFVCFGRPGINGMENSWTLIAGVNWSLRFEWIFYVVGLPLIFLTSRVLSRNRLLVFYFISLIGLVAFGQLRGGLHGGPLCLAHFLCGIIAAFTYENHTGRLLISSRPFHIAAALSLVILGFMTDSGNAIAIAVTLFFFLAAVGGLSIFGLLKTRAAIWMGDISYGIYLIHGLVLWSTFYMSKKLGLLNSLDTLAFVIVLPLMGLFVLALASLSYIFLEKPTIEFGRSLASDSLRKTTAGQPI
ncbi:hypothetical protein A1351_15570 [Methylosinus sp. R-45379]|nr:hypothetical protein A1351_15570 [Methylosinus sp. R-45379]